MVNGGIYARRTAASMIGKLSGIDTCLNGLKQRGSELGLESDAALPSAGKF